MLRLDVVITFERIIAHNVIAGLELGLIIGEDKSVTAARSLAYERPALLFMTGYQNRIGMFTSPRMARLCTSRLFLKRLPA